MADGHEQREPDKPKKEDYVFCAECGGYIFKPLLQTEEPFFAGEPTTSCPAGHALDHTDDGAPPEVAL